MREGVERGVFNGETLMKAGVGGVCIYMNGAVGGLMCTHPSLAVIDPFTGKEFNEGSFEKAAAEGKTLSMLALNAMEHPDATIDSASISLLVRTIFV